jgi:hypothetical protein
MISFFFIAFFKKIFVFLQIVILGKLMSRLQANHLSYMLGKWFNYQIVMFS